jgi:hypothetical protein
VGQPTIVSYPLDEGPYTHLVKNEEFDGRKIFSTRLPTRVIKIVSRVQARV